jgi:hypothetical protein
MAMTSRFPGIWLNAGPNSTFNTGPTKDPEVHVKARSTRFGLNFEWPDISKNLTLTGKIEGDFEGNFSEVDNRDVSSIRSNEPQLRLAFVRLDYHASENTDIFFVGGQDWTLFGSGALMNIVETTFNGAFWGNIYTRSPQLRGGFIQTLSKEHNVNLEGQFGVMMPSTGQILKLGCGRQRACRPARARRARGRRLRPSRVGRQSGVEFPARQGQGCRPGANRPSWIPFRRTSIVPNSSYCLAAPCGATQLLFQRATKLPSRTAFRLPAQCGAARSWRNCPRAGLPWWRAPIREATCASTSAAKSTLSPPT